MFLKSSLFLFFCVCGVRVLTGARSARSRPVLRIRSGSSRKFEQECGRAHQLVGLGIAGRLVHAGGDDLGSAMTQADVDPSVAAAHAARIAIVGIREEDVDAVWADLNMSPGHAVGLCVRSIKACPGTQYCRLGLQDSLAMGIKLDEKFHGYELPGKMKMGVSGCTNMCAENCIKDISLFGKKKGWTVMAGGIGTKKARLADVVAEDLDAPEALRMIERIIDFYAENGQKNERVGRMIERIGLETLCRAVAA